MTASFHDDVVRRVDAIFFTELMAEAVFAEVLATIIFIYRELRAAEKGGIEITAMSRMDILQAVLTVLTHFGGTAENLRDEDLGAVNTSRRDYSLVLKNRAVYVTILLVVWGRFLPISRVNSKTRFSRQVVRANLSTKLMAATHSVDRRTEVCKPTRR